MKRRKFFMYSDRADRLIYTVPVKKEIELDLILYDPNHTEGFLVNIINDSNLSLPSAFNFL